MIKIIGIGSALGDDRCGWAVIDALRETDLTTSVEFAYCQAPAADLLPLLEGAQRVLLIDALCVDAEPGSLFHWQAAALPDSLATLSGHALDALQVLRLANALQLFNGSAELYGIAIEPDAAALPHQALSPAVAAAVKDLSEHLLRVLAL